MSDLTEFYEAFRTEGYCTDCWVHEGHDEKCPEWQGPSANSETTEGSETSLGKRAVLDGEGD